MVGDYINRQREREREDAINSDTSSWIAPFAAGIGTIGLGALLLRKRIAEGGELLSNIFGILGMPQGVKLGTDAAANAGRAEARGGTTGLRSILNSVYNVNRNRVQLGPIDLIDDLRNASDILGVTRTEEARDQIKARTIEYINREFATGGNNTGFFTQGLERVTIDKVLKDKDAFKTVLGDEAVGVIERAQQHGLVGNNNIIDKKIFFNPNTKEIIDFRRRNLVSKLERVTYETGGKTVTQFARVPRFDLFGQSTVFSGAIPSGRGIAVVGSTAQKTITKADGTEVLVNAGERLFIGGKTFGFKGGKLIELQSGVSLRRAGTPLQPIAASGSGTLRIDPSQNQGIFGGVLNFLENTLGIGPKFASRRSLFSRLITDPLARGRAVAKGDALIVRDFYQQKGSAQFLDSVIGAENPEVRFLSSRGIVTAVEGGGESVTIQDVKGVKRFGILFKNTFIDAATQELNVIKRESYEAYRAGKKVNLTGDDFVVKPKTGGYTIVGDTLSSRSHLAGLSDIRQGELTAAGFKTSTSRFKYYTAQKGTGLKDLAAYGLYRVNALASEFMGMGLRPDHRILPSLGRLAALPIVFEAARQTALYADYAIESVTGVSPIKAAASVYAKARVLQQKFRETTGLQQGFNALENYFPGSVDSEGAFAVRSIIAPGIAANAMLARGNFKGALGAAAFVFGLIGGIEPGQTSEDLEREYTGDKKVPYRKGALWGLGYTPLFGGRPEFYGQGWYAKLMSDYKDKSLYGSEDEYWKYHANVFGIPMPTPSNLFGVLNLLNPYRLEEKQYESRPYAVSRSGLYSVPIFGPVLGATIGEILKPTVYRQPDELPLLKSGLASKGITPSMTQSIGIGRMNATAFEADDPQSILNLVQRQANIASEPLGVYKFAMEFFGVKTRQDLGTELATSDVMGSFGASLYDANIGGFFGQTEFIRRFFLSDDYSQYRRAASINPIRNNMPTFLPGTYSETDPNYFVDFTMGDPYSKIKQGEMRLPGVGYEALNTLHSGKPGQYDAVDKFLILADVAPYSAAYKKYEKQVLSMELDENFQRKVDEAIQQRREVVGVDTRYKRYEQDIVDMNLGEFEKAAYAPIRKAYDFLTHDILAEIPVAGSKLFPFRDPYEQYRKLRVEGSTYASWDRPYEDIVRPMLYDVALEDPGTAAMKGAALGYLISGPMRFFSPLTALSAGAAGAQTFSATTIAVGAFGAAGLSASRIAAGYDEDMIPFHIQAEEQAIDYMDKINYIKGSIIKEAGGTAAQAGRTFVGATSERGYRSALPTSLDRRYFDYFKSQTGGYRTQIMGGLPGYMSEGIARIDRQDFNTTEEAQFETLDFIDNNMIPSSDWLGWRPEVSAKASTLRLVKDGINGVSENIHRYGFFESHEIDLKTRLADFNSQSIEYVQSPMHQTFDSFIKSQVASVANASYSVEQFSTPYRSKRNLRIIQNRDQEFLNQLRNR